MFFQLKFGYLQLKFFGGICFFPPFRRAMSRFAVNGDGFVEIHFWEEHYNGAEKNIPFSKFGEGTTPNIKTSFFGGGVRNIQFFCGHSMCFGFKILGAKLVQFIPGTLNNQF